MSLRYRVLALTLTLAATPVAAQTTFLVGGSAGLDQIPSVLLLENPCGSAGDAYTRPFAEARLALSLGSGLGLEARGGSGPGFGDLRCDIPSDPKVTRPLEEGTTLYDPVVDGLARIHYADLRLRRTLHEGRTVLTLGPGLIMKGPLYLAGSLGRRWDAPLGAVRWGFDAQLAAYRMGWHTSTVRLSEDPEDPNNVLVEELSSGRIHLWEVGFGIRGVLEFGFE